MASREKCSVPCCGETIGSMYKFPKDPILRERWKSSCKVIRNVSNYMLVCYRHFRANDVNISISGKYIRLKTGAVPMLNLPLAIRRKGRRNCIVHTCQNDESQGVTLHFFPKKAELRQTWASVCKVPGKVSRNTRICGSHFSENDFVCGGHGLKILKSGVTPSRNLPISFPSQHKSKRWSVSSTGHACENEETFDSFTESSSQESEDAWIQRFIHEVS